MTRKELNSRGDTIVEVLIVLAVLGFAFSISYATASHGLTQSQNAEEHSYALGLLETQVEKLRTDIPNWSAADTAAYMSGSDFCMDNSSATPKKVSFGSYTVSVSAAGDDFSRYPNSSTGSCVDSSLYYQSIAYDSSIQSFDFRVRWDGLGSLGRQQEEINYKIHQISGGSSGFTL